MALVAAVAPAFANTSVATSINVSAVQHQNGTVTVTVSGNWTFAGQACLGRYGTGWAVGWWGVGSSHPLPSNNFALTDVSLITDPYQGENGNPPTMGTVSGAAGSIQFPSGTYQGQYFYAGTQFNGQEIFTQAFCNTIGTGTLGGQYSATATYPSASDVPPQICVNFYDIHGKIGAPKTGDYNALTNGDNSIKSKQFVAADNCGTTTITVVPAGGSIGSLGLVGLIALGMLLLFGGQAVIRRRRSTDTARG